MPRHVKLLDPTNQSPAHANLINNLTRELTDEKSFGQPVIKEEHDPKNGSIRINVFWDLWNYLSADDRSAVIVQAYRNVEGDDFVNRIGLLNGLTIPEAHAAGLLPFKVIFVSEEFADETAEPIKQYMRAMMEEGASILNYDHRPELRFATEEEAEACKQRLIARLPGTKSVWVVIHEFRLEPRQYWDFSDDDLAGG